MDYSKLSKKELIELLLKSEERIKENDKEIKRLDESSNNLNSSLDVSSSPINNNSYFIKKKNNSKSTLLFNEIEFYLNEYETYLKLNDDKLFETLSETKRKDKLGFIDLTNKNKHLKTIVIKHGNEDKEKFFKSIKLLSFDITKNEYIKEKHNFYSLSSFNKFINTSLITKDINVSISFILRIIFDKFIKDISLVNVIKQLTKDKEIEDISIYDLSFIIYKTFILLNH